jgi:hypothetical protein
MTGSAKQSSFIASLPQRKNASQFFRELLAMTDAAYRKAATQRAGVIP